MKYYFFILQIVSADLDDNQNQSTVMGDVNRGNADGNSTEKTLSYTIPREAFELALNNNPTFNGQYSVVYFSEKFFFSSDQNVSEVSLCRIICKVEQEKNQTNLNTNML